MKFQRFTVFVMFVWLLNLNPSVNLATPHRPDNPQASVNRAASGDTSAVTLECGSLLSDTISVAGEVDQFTFSGQTGQVIDLTLVQTAGFDAIRNIFVRFTLISPTNMQSGPFDANTQRSFTLLETGTYLVRVNASNLVSTGSYNLGLECRQPLGPVDGTLGCGSLLQGKIEAPGEVDLITFSGQAGQVIDLTLVQTSGFDAIRNIFARFTLFSPTNERLGPFDANTQRSFTLSETGTYLVRVNASNLFHTGSYNLGLECRQPLWSVDGILNCGSLPSGNIEFPGEVDLITFSGHTGQVIDLTLVQTAGFDAIRNIFARFTLFSPTNVQLGTFDANTQQSFTLPETGIYLVRVNASNLFHTGSYNLGLECRQPLGPVDGTLICNGPPLSGTIEKPGDVDLITFSGRTGQAIDLTLVQTAGFDAIRNIFARLTLFSPTNERLGAFDANTQQPFTLLETGTYLVRVNASNLFHTGSYNLGLLGMPCVSPSPPSITLTPDPLTIPAGASGDMTVTINPARTAAAMVMLSSSDTTVATVPASVTIPANSPSTTFQVMGKKAGMATITATLDGVSATAKVNVNNPVPALSSLAPSSATAGDPSFTLTVNGTNFVSDSKVRWNGSERTTSFVNATQLTAAIPATDIAMQGMASVTVFNPPPGGGVSNESPLTISLPTRIVRVVDASGNPGGRVTVPIQLNSQGDENALSFSLTFDPAILKNPVAALGSDAVGASLNFNSSQVTQGHLGILLALPANQRFTSGIREIVKVTFDVIANAAISTTVGFGDQPIPREVVSVGANPLSAIYTAGTITITLCGGFEADVAPRPNGNNDGSVTLADWVQVGRFVARLDQLVDGCEFQRADCAPKETKGDGRLSVADWTQAGRYAAGLDAVMPAGGPTSPTSLLALAARIGRTAADARDEIANARLLYLAETAIEYGASKSIAVSLDTRGDENAAGFSLSFDPRQWRFVSAVVGRDAPNAALQVNDRQARSGRVGFALALPAGETLAMGTRQLVVVTFAAVAEGQFETSMIRLADLPIAPEVVDANAKRLPARYRDETDAPAKTVRGNLK